MLIPIVLVGLFLIALERIIPDQKLPHVKGWWLRVVIVNSLQLSIIILGTYTWDRWFIKWQLLSLDMPPALGGLLGYFVVTFIFYWWHRWRHDINLLWLLFHQLHHSPNRIETITSFYKHPLEIIANSLIIGCVNHIFLGLNVDAAAWALLYASLGEYFYHMNISTPHWVGYFFQRPEMHRIHHQRNKHYQNFSDFPIWDMLFGTYSNPKTYKGKCGFKPERETQICDILAFKNVNNPYPLKKQ